MTKLWDFNKKRNRSYLVVFPDRYYSDIQVAGYFKELADISSIPIYPHGLHIRNGIGSGYKNWNYSLISHLLTHPNIEGMKEECDCLETCRKMSRDVLKDIPNFDIILAGGSKRRHNYVKNYVPNISYLAGLESILGRPVSFEEEDRFFGFTSNIGWHLSMRSAISIKFGFEAGRRKPFPKIKSLDKEKLKKVIESFE